MKYVTYRGDAGDRVGVLLDGAVWDAGFDGDMVAFIAAGAPEGRRHEVPGAQLLAPLRPRTMRDFVTFEGHMKNALTRLNRPIPDEWFTIPAFYKGMPDTVIGPEQEIPWPSYTDRLDHELELAAVIGKPGKDIAPADAYDHIFGYTIWNDMSARDTQAREMPLGMGPSKGKDWDGSNVLGPCIVTADEFDLAGARMEVRINGERWGGTAVSEMHHTFADLIAYASMSQTLRPGEVFGSGTATGGSGLELDRFLAEGDLIEMTVTQIGTLRNRVGKKEN